MVRLEYTKEDHAIIKFLTFVFCRTAYANKTHTFKFMVHVMCICHKACLFQNIWRGQWYVLTTLFPSSPSPSKLMVRFDLFWYSLQQLVHLLTAIVPLFFFNNFCVINNSVKGQTQGQQKKFLWWPWCSLAFALITYDAHSMLKTCALLVGVVSI